MSPKWTNTSPPFSRVMNPKPLASLNHFTVPVSIDELPPSGELKRRIRTKKIPQSLSVFAVSLQEHPELLECSIPLSHGNVKLYYSLSRFFPVPWAALGTVHVFAAYQSTAK